jgi:2-oxoisovalerate dehydrogenase E2 component (dihydrolipoyl transacylase)
MLPDLGEGLTEAEVIQWHVAPGDEVHVDQIVVTVETAKASVDLPCPYAGYVTTLHSEPGAVLEVGKPLLTVGAQESAGSGNVLVGYGTSPAKRSRRRRVTPQGRPSPARNGGPVAAARAGAPKVISPVVRRLAKDNGISLAGLAPTGPGGVIRRSDVEAVLRIGDGNVGSHTVAQEPSALRAGRCEDLRVPLRGIRKTISDNLTRSRREIPEATTWVDVDATALMAAKDEITAVNAAARIGLLALFARISVAGLRKFPELNARVDLQAQEIVQLADINLASPLRRRAAWSCLSCTVPGR